MDYDYTVSKERTADRAAQDVQNSYELNGADEGRRVVQERENTNYRFLQLIYKKMLENDVNEKCADSIIGDIENSLKKGDTTIREVGSPKDISIETAFAVEKGWIKGSRVIPCGSAIQSIYGHVPSIGTIANTKDELLYAIREKKTLFVKNCFRCQWIKFMDTGGAAGLEDVGPSMYDLDQL